MTYTEFLDQHSVAQTDIGIREHILAFIGLVRSLASRLVVDTNDHQTLVRDRVDKVLSANLDRVHGLRNGREQRGEQRERANGLLMLANAHAQWRLHVPAL